MGIEEEGDPLNAASTQQNVSDKQISTISSCMLDTASYLNFS